MAWFEFWVLAHHIFFILYSVWKNAKNYSKVAPILGVGNRLPKWESALLLLQKWMKQSDGAHFGGRDTTPKMGAAFCVFFGRLGLEFRRRKWKFATANLWILTWRRYWQSVSCFMQFKTQKWHSAVETLDCLSFLWNDQTLVEEAFCWVNKI